MITEDGQVFTEKEYEGYGTFGGKDIYDLIAEMNGLKAKEKQELRCAAIDLLFEEHITNGERTYSNKIDFSNWQHDKIKGEKGKSANQLIKEGWTQVHPNGYGDFEIAATKGIKLPKFVEKLPSKKDWKKVWDSLPYPENCSDQGYFYAGEGEDPEYED
ncbi:MAG TPA: hypothetical protein VNX68_13230 [Nitrosopumilaceae archaeon]|nr:hypothetical protein [Nitrosopumilaceae archaeon]